MSRPLSLAALFLALVSAGSALAQTQEVPAPAAPDAKKMVSWVVLTGHYWDLDLDAVRQKLDDVFPGQFLPPRQKGNFVVAGPESGQFMIVSNLPGAAGFFLLNNIPRPYADISEFAEVISDRAILGGIAKQCCWLSVDLIHRTTSDEEGYRFIERVLAKFSPPEAAFLVDPNNGATIAFDDGIRRRFQSGELMLPSP